MTILHPRVGFEIITVVGAGTEEYGSTHLGGTAVQVNVGRTLAFVSAAAGYPQINGYPGSLQIVGGTPGDQVTIQPDRASGSSVWVLLPPGETIQGTGQTEFRIYNLQSDPDESITIIKIGPSTWERVK